MCAIYICLTNTYHKRTTMVQTILMVFLVVAAVSAAPLYNPRRAQTTQKHTGQPPLQMYVTTPGVHLQSSQEFCFIERVETPFLVCTRVHISFTQNNCLRVSSW